MKTIINILLLNLLLISLKVLGQNRDLIKYARIEYQNEIYYGIIDDQNSQIELLDGNVFEQIRFTGTIMPISQVKILTPVEPSKVIAMAYNYASHTVNRPKPEQPSAFAKLPTCIVGPGDQILMPSKATNLHYEGELVVVFKKKASNIKIDEVSNYILGVTIGNDVTERNWQKQDARWLTAKASDTFGPIGPWIVSGLNYNDLLLETRVNGVTVQSQRTSDMFFDLENCVSHLSYFITFMPGDVLFLGTPGITSPIKPGDIVEVEIEGIGILSNEVVAAD